MSRYNILTVVYTPYEGYLPKRMEEIEYEFPADEKQGLQRIVVTPGNYEEKLQGIMADTIHLVKLYPILGKDITEDMKRTYYQHEPKVEELCETMKTHNN